MLPSGKKPSVCRAAWWGCAASVLMALAGCTSHEVTVTIKSVEGAKKGGETKTDDTTGAPAGYGNLVGKVTFTGSAPALAQLVGKGDPVKDAAVCSAVAIPDESLVVNSANQGIANVVIFLDKPKFIKPELKAAPTKPAIFDQKGCRFFPHMLIVRVGQPVAILNDDSSAHNTHTKPDRNSEFNSTIPINERVGLVQFKYTLAEGYPIPVKCDLHSWMKAYHFPIDHPYVAVTDADGNFRIDGLPAGKHSFKVWQEKVREFLDRKLEVTIEADKDTPLNLKYSDAKFK